MHRRLSLALGALALALLPSSSAFADTFFNFSFSGTVLISGSTLFSGSGVFDTVALTSTTYRVVGVTGSADGSTITGLDAIGAYPTGVGQTPNDNILIFPPDLLGTRYFDSGGVSFKLANGSDLNLNDTYAFENAVVGNHHYTELDSISVSLAPTPEPGSLLFLGTGMTGVAGLVRRRIKA